ncbi:MAG: hypothetical protein AAFN93_28335 [Bacteroidota bacterium]
MKSKKIYQIGFLVLILINATLIYLLVKRPQRPPMNRGSRQGSIIEKISAHLELTEEQAANYRLMAKQHGQQMRSFEADHRELVKAYFETFNSSSIASPDSIKIEILNIESEKLEYTYEHFKELKSILEEHQKARFELIIKDILAVLINDRSKRPPPPRD